MLGQVAMDTGSCDKEYWVGWSFKGYWVGWQGYQEVLVWVVRNNGSGVKGVKGYWVGC